MKIYFVLLSIPLLIIFITFISKFLRLQKDVKELKKKVVPVLAKINHACIDINIAELHKNPRYQDDKRLNKFEYQVYSQNGEDGIITEIFRRIGTTNKFFVEFGVDDGLENNTTNLLCKGWNGFWAEASQDSIEKIKKNFNFLINAHKLSLKNDFVTIDNINEIFKTAQVPLEFDLLSIDVDGNDYWLWKAIDGYKPRVVAIERNAMFEPSVKWVMPYNPKHIWQGSSYFGASLKSLEILGQSKGYKLVGCESNGTNAFFVRQDLVANKFCEPFTSENHHEPVRYHLQRKTGHQRSFGEFENI